ncbi:ficolin-1-like [Saccostrea cucullata]|uniref:ficolin-1-like n=1 Tax=Saccostrea cuccullata TaxID=36930 RepID=UPI002ED4B3F8
MCGPECTYFGVNLQRQKCRLYTGCHSTNSAVPEVGWRYYFPDSEGNDIIHQLTKNRPALYVSITLTNGTTLYQQYGEFSVNNETDNYRLYLAGPTEGTLGDSMRSDHDLSGMSFSTPDRDNDRNNINCAALSDRRGGWWFNACHWAFLNGPWSPEYWSAPWSPTVRDGEEIKETLMMIKAH